MIAGVFLLILAAIVGFLALTGEGSSDLPVGALLLLVGVFGAFFAAGIHVGAALGVLGLLVGFAYSDRPFWLFLGQTVWGPSSSFVLVAVPLFLLMGEILLRAGLSDKLYRALNLWLNRLPGGLLHTNIVASGVFSAISGSSVATAATMGSVALPFFRGTNYSPRHVMGSLAAGGALGNLIPPGITFIIYGLITETSVSALYLAAIGPSVLVVVAFLVLIVGMAGRRHAEGTPPVPLRDKVAALADLLPTLALILLVLGTIYAGLATPTESAALGVTGAMAFAALGRRFSLKMLHDSAEATARNTALVGLILIGAYVLNYVITALGIPQALANTVSRLPLPPWGIMGLIIGFYLALGTFMEGFSMVITTIPVIFPVAVALGYDPVWFGVVVTMLVEIALISPPDGTVLYVLQGMRSDSGKISDVFAGVMPFMLIYIGAVFLLMAFPGIALWLPGFLSR